MRRRLLAGFLAFAVVALVAIEVPFGLSLAANARSSALAELRSDGDSLGLLVGAALEAHDVADAQALVAHFARVEHATVIISTNGKRTFATGRRAPEELADPATKHILAEATRGKASGEEGGKDPDDNLLYAALPVVPAQTSVRATSSTKDQSTFTTVLLVAVPAAKMQSRIAHDWTELAIFGAVLLVLAALAGTFLARALTRGLAAIDSAVASIGAGRLSERVRLDNGPRELTSLATSVNEMAARLDELLQAQREFVADASHQLRTPMTALRLRLENLEESLRDDDRAELSAVITEADRLSRVVDGLLALARTEGARPKREAIDVGEALRERSEAWGALAEERRVSVVGPDAEAVAPESARALRALVCPGYLEQILDNLLSNAIDAAPESTSVALIAERVDGGVEIHVVDHGKGMSAEERERAFERFWRKNGDSAEGSGLGLAIVAQLVRASGGTVWLDSTPGGGIDAVVRLETA
ncbi:MAG: HAMP domain-containing sensor histidine kinase [Acidimicrobiales bacterium]